MKTYKVIHGTLRHNGVAYAVGATVQLDDKSAKACGETVELVGVTHTVATTQPTPALTPPNNPEIKRGKK